MKALIIIAQKNFQETEFRETKKVIEAKGIRAIVASKTTGNAVSTVGTAVKPDISLQDALSALKDYNAVIFIGGAGAGQFFDDNTALEIAKTADKEGKIVAAICIAPAILAYAGILNGRNATIWDSGAGDFVQILEDAGAQATGADVEKDSNIITANGPDASKKFAETIVNALNKK